jgi:hypothetical protein
MTNAIITASGLSTRFGGINKELLTNNFGVSFLEINLRKASNLCEKITLVTNPKKMNFHMDLVLKMNTGIRRKVKFAVRPSEEGELFNAFQLGIDQNCCNYLILADTYYTSDYLIDPKNELVFGLFDTKYNSRFSSVDLKNKAIHTKTDKFPELPCWGAVYLSQKVSSLALTYPMHTHIDTFLENVMKSYKTGTFSINNYYDIGTPERYKEFLDDYSVSGYNTNRPTNRSDA